MKEYVVSLPYVDEHEQGEGFVEEILEISNGVDDDARPVFVTEDQSEAIGRIENLETPMRFAIIKKEERFVALFISSSGNCLML